MESERWTRIQNCVFILALAACYCVTVRGCFDTMQAVEQMQPEIIKTKAAVGI